MTVVGPAVPIVLAAALLLADARTAPRRLGVLVEDVPDAAGEPVVLRPAWVLVGAGSFGAVGWLAGGGATGAVLGVTTATAAAWVVRRLTSTDDDGTDGVTLAGIWDLIAVCLQAGLPVATAVGVAAAPLPGGVGSRLRRVAGLLALGADPSTAWRSVEDRPALAVFARAAGRSAGTGAALAQVARAEGERLRTELVDTAEARAQRAAVLITGPLGLCFLPAFLVLGIAPVVIGLAGQALARW